MNDTSLSPSPDGALSGVKARELRVYSSADALARAVASDIGAYLGRAAAGRMADDPVEVGISGGFTTTVLLPALLSYAADVDWSRVRFWWVDERFVPAGHEDRNDELAISNVLRQLPGVRWVSMPHDLGQGLDQAGRDFADQWEELMGSRSLDVALLGMGPDGHIASLFPGDAWFEASEASPDVIVIDDSPKPPPQRISLSMPVLQDAEWIILATSGESKAQAIAGVLGGASPELYPAAALLAPTCAERTSVYLDTDAASTL